VSPAHIVRNEVVQCFGTPAVTIGSVNEPREREEHGYRFNEKWIYRLPRPTADAPVERHVYWLRYDFVAAYLVAPDGSLAPEDLASCAAEVRSRRWIPPRAAITTTR
jgi:hypothetical protein